MATEKRYKISYAAEREYSKVQDWEEFVSGFTLGAAANVARHVCVERHAIGRIRLDGHDKVLAVVYPDGWTVLAN